MTKLLPRVGKQAFPHDEHAGAIALGMCMGPGGNAHQGLYKVCN